MPLPAVAVVPPILKWFIGAYIAAMATVVVVIYTTLTVITIDDWFNKQMTASFESLKPGLYKNWTELRYDRDQPFHLHPPSFENSHYLEKILKRSKDSYWYRELDTGKFYSLSIEKIHFEIPDKIYSTEPFACEKETCQITAKFQVENIKLPLGYESGIINLFDLIDNYVTPSDIQFNYSLPESKRLSYWFLPLLINTELTKRYRGDNKINHRTNFTMVIPYQQTRVGFYSLEIESASK